MPAEQTSHSELSVTDAARATLANMHRDAPWVWMHCARNDCYHHAPIKLDPLIERWGSGVSSNKLRRSALCTKCGHKGASLTLPSAGAERGWYPFPVSEMTR